MVKAKKITVCALFAALLAASAQIALPTFPPITLQTLVLFLCAGILGAKWGSVSVAVYIALGALGLPVFAGFSGGLGVLAGPTGGFILGFPLSVPLSAYLFERAGNTVLRVLALASGLLLCYAAGTLWFAFVTGNSIFSALILCVLPFLVPDAIKTSLAVFLIPRIKKAIRL